MEQQISELGKKRKRPVKPFFNVRAHSNPLADNWFANTPSKPSEFDWSAFYPEMLDPATLQGRAPPQVEMADIGCGFGGLLCKYMAGRSISMGLSDEINSLLVPLVPQLPRSGRGDSGEGCGIRKQ